MAIQIQISDEQWTYLNNQKQRGETFQEVLDRMINKNKEVKKNEHKKDNELA